MNSEWNYSGRELESMDSALNYHRWILDLLTPYLGRHVVEVGAGTGSLSTLLLERNLQSLVALEPSANMYPLLEKRLKSIRSSCNVTSMQRTLSDAGAGFAEAPPDSILYVNVLEHIEDDAGELHTAWQALPTGGRALVFVPAHAWLMSEMDRHLGHFQRYTRSNLIEKFETAGFKVCFSAYFDLLGILPWWLKYRLLGSTRMEPAAVQAYDRFGVPVSRVIDSLTNSRMGKNVIVVGEKL